MEDNDEKLTANSHNADSVDLSESAALLEDIEKETKSVAEIFKERLAVYRKTITKGMVFADQLDLRDPQMVSEVASDIYKTLREQELDFKIEPDYLPA